MEAHPRGSAIASGMLALLAVAGVAWEISEPGPADGERLFVLALAALCFGFCGVAIWRERRGPAAGRQTRSRRPRSGARGERRARAVARGMRVRLVRRAS